MLSKSLKLLDFPSIREDLASMTHLGSSMRLALNLAPSYSANEVEGLQQKTAEGLAFLEKVGDISLRMAEEPYSIVARTALNGTISGTELNSVADWVDMQCRTKMALCQARSIAPKLAEIAQTIPDLREIHNRIRIAIGKHGEVKDQASPTLTILREKVRVAYKRLTRALEQIIESEIHQESLQDQVISIRGERLVLQVKVEHRHQVPGILIDTSKTGATLFIEPLATVELCNTWKELGLEEQREISRILEELSAMVGDVADDIQQGAQAATQLDLILAKARYSISLNGVAPGRPPSNRFNETDGNEVRLQLIGTKHPLLGMKAVPINVLINSGGSVLIITGPNTGGKTVTMKTVGLLAAMNQSGLHIPAEANSFLPVFDGIYANMGDQQSIRESASSFSSHIRSIIEILHHATPNSLALLDELGTSTDPEEGSALAKAILTNLASSGTITIATTHHRSVATHAEVTPGMMNASVDFDPDTMTPNYQLTLGVPGTSHAMSVAEQLGMPEGIMDQARSLVAPDHTLFKTWVNKLQHERNRLRDMQDKAVEARASAEKARENTEALKVDMESNRNSILRDLHIELTEEYKDLRKKLRRAQSILSWDSTPAKVTHKELQDAGADLDDSMAILDTMNKPSSSISTEIERKQLIVGAIVDIPGLGVQGTVASIGDPSNDVEIAVGGIRLTIDASRLSLRESNREGHEFQKPEVGHRLGPALGTMELNLRGFRVDEAVEKLEEFLDKALRDGLRSVRIIHGKGTGALRATVREHLERHPLAKSFARETPDKGGDGVTLVELA